MQVRSLTNLEKDHPIYKQFVADMDDDFNTPKAIASLFDLSRETNDALSNNADKAKHESLYQLWRLIGDQVLGIIPTQNQAQSTQNKDEVLDSVMKTVINWRMEARAAKDFKMSDAIRDDLAKAGVVLEDGKDGTSWSIKDS